MRIKDKREGLVVDDVPVEYIQFGEGHGLNQSFDVVNTEIVPGRIYHDSLVLKQRLIFDGGKRNFTIFEQLRQRFKGVDISRIISVF